MESTIAPVPSGEASSTTRTSIDGSCARMAGIRRAMLNFSLKVGTMTSVRSAKASPVPPDSGAKSEETDEDGEPGDRLSGLIGRAGELQPHRSSSGWELDSDQAQIRPPKPRRLAVNRRSPPRIVVLRDHETGSVGRRRTQCDFDVAGRILRDACDDG